MTKKGFIDYNVNPVRYWDKNGVELHDGDTIKYPDGKTKRLYLTTMGELGTDATNPLWIESGRAVECEYGIYPLDMMEIKEIEKV